MERETVRREHCETYEYPPSVMRNLIECKRQLKEILEHIETTPRLSDEYNKIEQPDGSTLADAIIKLFKRVSS